VDCVSSKEWIVLFDFQSFRMILFILGSSVARSRSAFLLSFCALKRDNDAGSFLSHGLVLKLYFNIEFLENERQK